jgi:EAL domain-containing protein (putative c-di-GMP-specific phosphodiesterase class I)
MWGIDPATITLEIAESSMIADAERSVAILTRLKAIGIGLSLDDFGSGFSSLSHLKRFPIDEIKIDRPFVERMVEDKSDRALVHAAIDLGHHFGFRVVAEGVQRAETRDLLKELGCDVAQGNFVSVPLSAEELAAWWRAQAG